MVLIDWSHVITTRSSFEREFRYLAALARLSLSSSFGGFDYSWSRFFVDAFFWRLNLFYLLFDYWLSFGSGFYNWFSDFLLFSNGDRFYYSGSNNFGFSGLSWFSFFCFRLGLSRFYFWLTFFNLCLLKK